jgi:hypothetical protein
VAFAKKVAGYYRTSPNLLFCNRVHYVQCSLCSILDPLMRDTDRSRAHKKTRKLQMNPKKNAKCKKLSMFSQIRRPQGRRDTESAVCATAISRLVFCRNNDAIKLRVKESQLQLRKQFTAGDEKVGQRSNQNNHRSNSYK